MQQGVCGRCAGVVCPSPYILSQNPRLFKSRDPHPPLRGTSPRGRGGQGAHEGTPLHPTSPPRPAGSPSTLTLTVKGEGPKKARFLPAQERREGSEIADTRPFRGRGRARTLFLADSDRRARPSAPAAAPLLQIVASCCIAVAICCPRRCTLWRAPILYTRRLCSTPCLIANRGEIACRVIRTCQRLGIEAVAVYSSADAKAKHVGMADRAIEIGGAPASQSYLNGEAIIKAAKKAKAQAIHPATASSPRTRRSSRRSKKEGLTFIGPSSKVIAQMGDKIMARRLAREAGVPISPGAEGEIDDAQAVAIARGIGFPLMIKAADGGGGMGIRVVNDIDEVPER